MFDHVSLKVKDYARSKRFFEKALAPLGYSLIEEYGKTKGGFGAGKTIHLYLGEGEPHVPGVHVAFAGPNRKAIGAFHAAALAAGGKDNGAPGIRADYAADYYAAFVHDPDGNNIEAVCHGKGE